MKELMQRLGFERVTDMVWLHKEIGTLILDGETKEADVVKLIKDKAVFNKQKEIRQSIGIEKDS